MTKIASLCVYCGSRTGTDPRHAALAARLGTALAARGISLVYGAGGIGLMTAVADAALAAGGRVIGVIPKHLARAELLHDNLTETIVVASMHARKQLMFERADAFAVLPGGFGTLDELIEVITWRQLGLHDKPILLLDSDNYWAPLRTLFEHLIESGFAPARARQLYRIVADVEALFAALEAAPVPRPPAPSERL